jgi:hypothetical protein
MFFLGGNDLEMAEIRSLLRRAGAPNVIDKGLSWGAKASSYDTEIRLCIKSATRPVLIELENDIGLDASQADFVDHHGASAGASTPTSLEQVFRLLERPAHEWSRWMELVAANDRGGIEGLAEAGASTEEIAAIRKAEHAVLGITVAEEAEAERAVAAAEHPCKQLTVIRLAHARTAPVFDRIEPALGGSGYENIVILSPDETNFSGEWRIVEALDHEFPGGWTGGRKPIRGYWGLAGVEPRVVEWLVSQLCRGHDR